MEALQLVIRSPRILFIVFALISIQCKKVHPDSDIKEVNEQKTGFDYFLNTNEVWYYREVDPPNPSEFISQTEYRSIKDTSAIIEGERYTGRLMRQYYLGFSIFEGDTFNRLKQQKDILFLYNKDIRRLYSLEDESFPRLLADFKSLDTVTSCFVKVQWRDTMKVCSNHYNRWINAANQEIIEGIHLGVFRCAPIPAFGQTGIPLVEFKYTSDECTYEWKAIK